MAAAFRDVEAATLALDGPPPITQTTFPTCRAHYPGGSSGRACRLLPRSCSLPQMAGGSASALSLSRPARASLVLTARRIAQLPTATFVTRLQPLRLSARAARQLPDQSTTLWVESSSTSDARLRGALPILDMDGCFPRLNSLFLEKLSLICRWKFPVTLRREFTSKLLNPRVDRTRKSQQLTASSATHSGLCGLCQICKDRCDIPFAVDCRGCNGQTSQ